MTIRSRWARVLVVPTAAVLAAGLMTGCSGDDGAADQAPTTQSSEAPAGGLTVNADGTEVSYEGVAGETALELLQQLDPTAMTSGEGAGAFVTAIGGHEADASKEFWAFYVNGEAAQVGAGSYEMQDGDEITWKLETF